MSHEISLSLGAETVSTVERNTGHAVFARHGRPAGVEGQLTFTQIVPEAGRSRVWPLCCPARWSASGRRGAEADDARTREVAHRHSSYEAGEQSGAIRSGVGGAKGGDQGEWRSVAHVLDSEPCSRKRYLHTCHKNLITCGKARKRLTAGPKVRAVCGKAARTDPCGGREVTCVPTATRKKSAFSDALFFGETHH